MSQRWSICVALCAASLAPAQVTYSKDVSRIFQVKCQQCHRDGDIAPFALNNYDAALQWSRDIDRVLRQKIMPPWKPADGFGEFRGSYQLSEDERQMILDWIAAGSPEGDPHDLPDAPPAQGEWALGAPDVTLSMLNPYTPPIGQDVYRCFVIPTGLNDAAYLSAIDVLPGVRQVVHHVLLFQDTQGVADKLDGKDGQPGYPCFGGPGITISGGSLSLNDINSSLGGWAPGQRPQRLPDGVAIQLQKNAKIIIQVHYHPFGRTGEDQTRIGLYFSKQPVSQRLFQVPIVNTSFKIPPGEESYEVNASFTVLPFLDAHAIWVYPHMHLLGRQIKVDILNRDKSVTPVILEDKWDFNWQGAYTFKEALPAPAGSTVRLKCTFNNSEE